MSNVRKLLTDRAERRVLSLKADDRKARATDAARLLRQLIDVLEPFERTPNFDRAALLLDEAATIIIAELEVE